MSTYPSISMVDQPPAAPVTENLEVNNIHIGLLRADTRRALVQAKAFLVREIGDWMDAEGSNVNVAACRAFARSLFSMSTMPSALQGVSLQAGAAIPDAPPPVIGSQLGTSSTS